MGPDEIHSLIEDCRLPDSCENAELRETHISWIILTDHLAFKIKRPVKYSFLDFSTLEKRKYYCKREVDLNQRLAPAMYQGVLPIYENQVADNESPKVKDYAVKMLRMDNELAMDVLLKQDKITEEDIGKIAAKVARFHNGADVIRNTFDTNKFQQRYADILSVVPYVDKHLGGEWKQLIEDNVEASKTYLFINSDFLNQRVISGFIRDCHGDLNAKNIFIYDDPVIFDCIEFNDEYRQIDVLNDIAFLCVDLEFFGREDFSDQFYGKYLEAYGTLNDGGIDRLFQYYKSYRANVRAKVSLLHAQNSEEGLDSINVDDVKKYLMFMDRYKQLYLSIE